MKDWERPYEDEDFYWNETIINSEKESVCCVE